MNTAPDPDPVPVPEPPVAKPVPGPARTAFGYLARSLLVPGRETHPEVHDLHHHAAHRDAALVAVFIEETGERDGVESIRTLASRHARTRPDRIVVLLPSRNHLGTDPDVQAATLADLDHADADVLILDEQTVPDPTVPDQSGTTTPGSTTEPAGP